MTTNEAKAVDVRAVGANVACKGKMPEQCADLARESEAAGQWAAAAEWWLAAQYVTAGHSRSAMYRDAEERCREKVGK